MSNFLDEWHKLWDEEDRKMTEQQIEAARKQGKIYDIDRLFWNGGKLFGQDIYYNPKNEKIPCFDVIKNNHQYIF